ncbi:MAG: hypothetical protein CMP10_17610 [Zetaproteobacteria bacterium]|nr:hypothetical protein [Pseudobdellovibrionaceae bacterium]
MSFELLGLAPELVTAIEQEGYTKPTPIQKMAIPKIINGQDVIAGAQTGTGKTAAFTLPILQNLLQNIHPDAQHNIKALILTPTRELANQVYQSVLKYSQNTSINAVVLYGGVDYAGQSKKLAAGVDIVVATPGRLLDHQQRGNLKLHTVKHLVLDEADRMLDMGFAPVVRKIMHDLPRDRQTMLFSATFTPEVKALSKILLKTPVSIQADQLNSAAKRVSHVVHPVDPGKKASLLSYLIGSNNWQQVIIFTRTKKSADILSKELILDGIKNMVIHGDRTQSNRTRALAKFKEGAIQALVATDIAARGLDIHNLPCVINYELPNIAEDYVHRVGRTGRAGQSGEAVTLVTQGEVYRLNAVEKFIKQDLEKRRVIGFEPVQFDPEAEAQTMQKSRSRFGKPSFGARSGANRKVANGSGSAGSRRVTSQKFNDRRASGFKSRDTNEGSSRRGKTYSEDRPMWGRIKSRDTEQGSARRGKTYSEDRPTRGRNKSRDTEQGSARRGKTYSEERPVRGRIKSRDTEQGSARRGKTYSEERPNRGRSQASDSKNSPGRKKTSAAKPSAAKPSRGPRVNKGSDWSGARKKSGSEANRTARSNKKFRPSKKR